MSFFTDQIQSHKGSSPCLFYPMAPKMEISMTELLTDSKVQERVLTKIAHGYPVNAVIRMTELWCEGASFGMSCTIADDSFPRLGDPICTEPQALADVKIPQIENKTTAPLIEAVRLAAPKIEKPLIIGVTGPFTLASVLNGVENIMMTCMTAPDQIHDFLSRITDYIIEYISAYKSVGAAGIILAEPSASMISPAMMEEFSNAYIQKIIKAVQDDTFSLIYHNCGAVNPHLKTISQLDADAFHFGSDVDMGLALDILGENKFIMGNVDPRLFITATPDEIEKQTTALLNTYGERDNWRLSTGCDLSPDSSMENVECFLQTVNRF